MSYSKDWANSSSTIKLAFDRKSRHGALICDVFMQGSCNFKVSGVAQGLANLKLQDVKLMAKRITEFNYVLGRRIVRR